MSSKQHELSETLTDNLVNFNNLHEMLTQYGQQHVLQHWSHLNSQEQSNLTAQLSGIDLAELASLVNGQDEDTDFGALARRASSPPAVRADGSGADWSPVQARERGERALRNGELGAVIVAGGQGTRLGFDQPKGMFPIGPVSGRTLFQFFADRLLAVNEKYGCRIPLYIMTSDATDQETRKYFAANENLGIPAEDLYIFKQGVMPAVDAATGKLLMQSTSSLALSPDGHGGTVSALHGCGCLADAAKRGIQHLAYIQVDNPLAHLCEPELIGHHLMAASEMTTQVVQKRHPTEKVGNVVLVDGQVQIIEYSDLPESAAEATHEDGSLKLWAGNIAVHLFNLDFLQRVVGQADSLPFHRALKKVPFCDDRGQLVTPAEPNATKFERFIFDLLPIANNAFVVESRASEAFAPVKNANGAETDTPNTAKKAIVDLHRHWLEEAGLCVDQGVQVEINPRLALKVSDLPKKIATNQRIDTDRYFDTQLES
ncbi:MAG TPA: UDP-N-acetylglucosamine pyrophosphorylase [Rhodopirellula sp.]|nr:MAG: UDP-N-acetylglucosamine pyrophosphorylase [Saprospirales bacterium TMED214]HBV62486.1 UDP-N-acetylglucosamine pyrophosphorylase [Rhodopirellula sp.]